MRAARLPLLLLFASSASALTLCRGRSFARALPRSSHIRAAEPTSTNEVEPKLRWNPQTRLGYGWSLLSLPFTFTLYLSGSSLLDSVLVQVLGFNRASGDAFGPFVTLLGLIYSILLGQIYEYYFNRQGVIQDALYQEISALSLLAEVTDFLADRCAPALRSSQHICCCIYLDPIHLQVRSGCRPADRPPCDPPRAGDAASPNRAEHRCPVAEPLVARAAAAHRDARSRNGLGLGGCAAVGVARREHDHSGAFATNLGDRRRAASDPDGDTASHHRCRAAWLCAGRPRCTQARGTSLLGDHGLLRAD
jgi:hypothetical protein